MQADTVLPASASTIIERFPGTMMTSLFAAALFGALGAFAADLAADGGKLDRAGKTDSEWSLGFIGRLIVGSWRRSSF